VVSQQIEETTMRRTKSLLAYSVLPLFLVGCNDDDDDFVEQPAPELPTYV